MAVVRLVSQGDLGGFAVHNLGLGGLVRFLFQAADGIRDWSVTGVQTCALPIFVLVGGLAITVSATPAFAQSPILSDVKHDTHGQPIEDGQSVRIDVELALVNVTVTDPYNRLVTGLDAD